MISRERRASSSLSNSNSHNRSRPFLTSRTSPAAASTFRCLVTACRVICVPEVSCVIDIPPPAHSAAMRSNRVSSPRAANTGAALRSAVDLRAPGLGGSDMLRDVLQLDLPALGVTPERLQTPIRRDLIEAGLDHRQQSASD